MIKRHAKNKSMNRRMTKSVIKRKVSINRSPVRINNANDPVVSVVIPVMNERKTIARVIHQVSQVHPRTEVIVVTNGSTDGSSHIARKMGAKVLNYDAPLGHDVGRSIGAREAKGQIIVFVDGDFIISAKELVPFIRAIQNGQDIALNSYSGPTKKHYVHNVVAAKHALNIALYRPDLIGASMTTIPHALSRKALEMIGIHHLACPPLAHAIGIHIGLKVSAPHYIHVGPRNPIKRKKKLGKDPLEQLIVGDHLEAINWLTTVTNRRGNHTDLTRLRDRVR